MTMARIYQIIRNEMILEKIDGTASAIIRAADLISYNVGAEQQELIDHLLNILVDIYIEKFKNHFYNGFALFKISYSDDIALLEKLTGKTIEELI